MAEVLAERRREQERLVGLAREYVERLSRRFPIVGAAVVGSVARGDFNLWSDVDVVVVTEDLPDRTPERGVALALDAPPGVQAVGFSPEEFEAAWLRRNPLAREASQIGVALVGQDFFRRPREP